MYNNDNSLCILMIIVCVIRPKSSLKIIVIFSEVKVNKNRLLYFFVNLLLISKPFNVLELTSVREIANTCQTAKQLIEKRQQCTQKR